jgi:hypothetical protein
VRVVGHIGSAAPLHYSLLALLADEGVGLFVAYNGDRARPLTAENETLAAFMDRFYPTPAAARPPPPDFARRAGQFTGEYRRNNLGGSYTTAEKVRRVLGEGNRRVGDPGDGTLEVSVLGKRVRFVEVAPDLFREAGGQDTLLFRRNHAGEVTKAVFSGSPAYTYERLTLHETPAFNQALLAATTVLFGSALVAAAVAWVARRRRPADLRRSVLARAARWVAGSAALLNLLFLAGLIVTLGSPTTLMGDFSQLRALLMLPLFGTILTGAVAVFTVLAWRRRLWAVPARLHYTALALASVAFIWFLGTWNLLGFHL